MILRFKEFNEKFNVNALPKGNIKVINENLVIRLKEIKEYILTNIIIKNNLVYYSNFEQIDTRVILRDLNNEFTQEYIEFLKVKDLFEDINKLMELAKPDVKRKIREKFYSLINKLKIK
jgi:hypothetical protein